MGVRKVMEGPTVVKSASDKRLYLILRLANGLSVLLVHDPTMVGQNSGSDEDDHSSGDEEGSEDTEKEDEMECLTPVSNVHPDIACCSHGAGRKDSGKNDNYEEGPPSLGHFSGKAAAAMCVGVGSFSDPQDAQGLAHFLEHMLFMGSSKFPDENEVLTVFISPLVKADAMEREVQAIDSEFAQVLQDDTSRLLQLQCHTANPSHPFHTFSWGNRKSLSEPMKRGVDMRAKLLQLYNDHYKAGHMKLVVLGGEPLEILKDWVLELFGKVGNGGQARLRFPWNGPIWESGHMYQVESVEDQHWVVMTWPLPCLESAYLRKPQDYISHLVGHEGAGSLLSLLKVKGWATDTTAGIGESGYDQNSAGYMFNITIHLTVSGLKHVLKVVGLLYQYMKLLRMVGPQNWVFKELQSIAAMEFRFPEEESTDDYVVHLASNMHLYTEPHIIYGDYAFEQWDPKLVADLLCRIAPSNMRLDIMTKLFEHKSPGVQIEPWFGVPYTVSNLPADLLQVWADPPHINPALHIPVVNEFIPHDFTIRKGRNNPSDAPRILLDEPARKVWYKLDQTFNTPRANTYFLVACPAVVKSIKAVVLTDMYIDLLEHELQETFYLANVAKLESSITVAGGKLELKFFGFNEKLLVLAQKVVKNLTTLVPRDNSFQVIKENLEQAYQNANMKPLKHSTYLRLQALKKRFWHVDDKLKCLRSLGVSDLTDFIPHILNQTYIEALCHGNLSEQEALSIANIFKEAMVRNVPTRGLRRQDRLVKLPAGSSLLYSANVKNKSERNSAVEMYFQVGQNLGKQSIRMLGIVDLFQQIVYEPCFNQLRTKEQLGYQVDCGMDDTCRMLGFCFRVQSSKFSPPFIERRIKAFIAMLPKILNKITHEEFKSYKDALVEEIMEKDHSLLEESDRHWDEIWDKRYLFEAQKLEAAALKTITKREVISWFHHFVGDRSSRRKLSTHIWANTRAAKGRGKGIRKEGRRTEKHGSG